MNISRKLSLKSLVLLVVLIAASCSQTNSQPTRESLPGIEITPGSDLINNTFFAPFKVTGRIVENKGGNSEIFRDFVKEMYFDGKAIKQVLTYSEGGSKTGVHTTLYDPKTLQVIFWEYKSLSSNTHFAFKADGTKLAGTQNPADSTTQWQEFDLGVRLFQNESRELFFRALHNMKKGTQVKFPVIGMQSPYHGWLAYEYQKDKNIEYGGKTLKAKIWNAVGNSNVFYAVIDEAPYVIKREVPAGKKSKHVFIYDPL